MPRKIFLFAAFALLAAGCASPRVKAPEMKWTSVALHQSGGIMGLSRSIQILSNGVFTASDERAKKNLEGVLSAAELFDLDQKIAALGALPIPPDNAACADCFVYALDIQGKGIRASLNDVSLPGSGFESLIAFLRGLLDKALE